MAVQLKKSRALEALNMTPLIDVVFILLIFFLVAAQFTQESNELAVKLPSARSAVPMTVKPQVMTISVRESGELFVDGVQMDIEQVTSAIQQAVISNPISQTVMIRGDRRVSFQHVVSIMDLCNRLKVPSYKIATSEEAPQQ